MNLYEELHAEELKGHVAYLEKINNLIKKNLNRQNAPDSEKRSEAEKMLKVLGDLQTLLEKCSDDFPYDAAVIRLYDFIRASDLDSEKLISLLKEVLSGKLESARDIGDNLKLKNEFVLYNEFVDIVNWLGGNFKKIDLSLSEEEIAFEERLNMAENWMDITMESGDDPEDGLECISDYLVEANKSAEGKPLYEKYKRVRSEAMVDLVEEAINLFSFSRYKKDCIFIGMEPVGEEQNGIVTFPLTMHVREFGVERTRVDYNQPIPGVMEVAQSLIKPYRWLVYKIKFTFNGKEYLLLDRISRLMVTKFVTPQVLQFFGNSIDDFSINYKKETEPLTDGADNWLLYTMVSGNNFIYNGQTMSFPKNDPMELSVVIHFDDNGSHLFELSGFWGGNKVVYYLQRGCSSLLGLPGIWGKYRFEDFFLNGNSNQGQQQNNTYQTQNANAQPNVQNNYNNYQTTPQVSPKSKKRWKAIIAIIAGVVALFFIIQGISWFSSWKKIQSLIASEIGNSTNNTTNDIVPETGNSTSNTTNDNAPEDVGPGRPLQAAVVDSHEMKFSTDTIIDTVGNKYQGYNIGILGAENKKAGFVKMGIKETDVKLVGVITVYDESSSLRTGILQAYVDDGSGPELVYESEKISRVCSPFMIDIDVKGKKNVELRFSMADNSSVSNREYLILDNLRLIESESDISQITVPSKEYKDGIGISQIKVTMQNKYSTAVQNPTDTTGKKYASNNLNMISMNNTENGYAYYYVGENYKNVAGIIAPQDDSNSVRTGLFIIRAYIDNSWVEVYESENITRTTEPTIVAANIEGAKWIEFLYKRSDNNGYSYDGNLLLSDFALYRDITPNIKIEQNAMSDSRPLSEMKIVQSRNFEFISKKQMDTIGNTYIGSNIANISMDKDDNGYVDYYVGGNYNHLVGVVSPNDESWLRRKGVIQIYTKNDDKWSVCYESNVISRTTAPFILSADLNGAKWVRIVYKQTDDNTYYSKAIAILSDMTLSANEPVQPSVPKPELSSIEELSDKKIVQSDGYSVASVGQEDFLGNKYIGKNVEVIQNGGYCACYLGGNYSEVAGKVVPRNDSSKTRTCKLRIYTKVTDGDWNMVYESNDINNSSNPLDFSANVSGAEWLWIQYDKVDKNSDSNKAYGIITECFVR